MLSVGGVSAIPTTKTIREGEIEFDIIVPSVVIPDVVYPDIHTIQLEEIAVIKPCVALSIILQANKKGILFYDTTKTSALICGLNVSGVGNVLPIIYSSLKKAKSFEIGHIVETFNVIIDRIQTMTKDEAEQVMSQLSPVGTFMGKEREFYDAWLKKDFRAIKVALSSMVYEQHGFFTAWGIDKDFTQVNMSNMESLFPYQVFYIYQLGHDWRDKFIPQSNFILVINYSISTMEIQSLLELISEYRDKIKLIILPWGSHNEFVNNYDNRNVSTYKTIANWADKIFYSIKEIQPDIPVYLTISYTTATMDDWFNSFDAQYDGIALWNITSSNANFKAVYERIKKYSPNIVLSGMFGFSFSHYPKYRKTWDDVKEVVPETSNTIRDAGFRGVIWIKYE